MPLTTLSSGGSAQGWGAGLRRRYTAEVLADSPLAFWLLADTSGTTVADTSGNSRTLTYYNSPSLDQVGPSANIAKSVSWDGANDIAYGSPTASFNYAASGNWTMEVWFKTSLTGTAAYNVMRVADNTGGSASETGTLYMGVGAAGTIRWTCANTALSGRINLDWAGGLNDALWHHVVVTSVSGGAATLYVDNVSRASSTTGRNTDNTTNRTVQIGAFNNNGTYQNLFTGNIAAAAFYSTTLSTDRIQAHYLAGK